MRNKLSQYREAQNKIESIGDTRWKNATKPGIAIENETIDTLVNAIYGNERNETYVYIGKEIQVNLFKPIEVSGKKTKEVIGVLENFDIEQINIIQDKETIKLDRKNISQIKTVYDWNSIEEDNFKE